MAAPVEPYVATEMKIWTDGCDFVFARNESRIPAIMNCHYRAIGHLDRGQWREVAEDEVVVFVAEWLGRVFKLLAKHVSGLTHEGWLGSVTWRSGVRTSEGTTSAGDCRTSGETCPGCLLPTAS